jgi:hypothetical protein
MSITSKFLVFFFGLTYSSATLTVEVDLISYRNPNSEDCNGGNCDGVYYGTCDNVFHFCLRVVGSQSCLASLGTNYVQDDSMTFSSYDLSRLGISNPLVFSSISTSVSSACSSCSYSDNNQQQLFFIVPGRMSFSYELACRVAD